MAIDKVQTFCDYIFERNFDEDYQFTEILKELDIKVKATNPKVTTGALSNAHGDWYEWLLAVCAWNYFVDNSASFLALPLPNIVRFDVARLYVEELYLMVEDLRRKINESTSVQLITSNPDFVIIDTSKITFDRNYFTSIKVIDSVAIAKLLGAHVLFVGKCSFEDIVGYMSVKTSLRPDRRLQIPHEGSLMKAIYTHLQTRKWHINPKGLKYYAIATKVSTSDRNALRTVATHSITTVHSLPQAAVDEVFEASSIREAKQVFQQIFHLLA